MKAGTAFIVIVLLALYCGPAQSVAGEKREIVLRDGSVITGEVISLENGVYTVRSESLGELRLQDSEIRTIGAPSHQGQAAATGPGEAADEQEPKAGIKSLQSNMLTSPGILGMILSLRNDPDVQDILLDDEVMALIMSGNTEALKQNQKFMQLMKNPKIRAIIDQMTK